MLCLTANVGGIGNSDYKIPFAFLNPPGGLLLIYNKSQNLADTTLFKKFYSVVEVLHFDADAHKTHNFSLPCFH